MSQQILIDGFAFARDGRLLEGRLPVARLGRLHDLLAEVSGEVRYRLQGVIGPLGRPQLWLDVEGDLSLSCQRCLEAVSHALQIECVLELVPEGAELSQEELEDDSKDFLPVAGQTDVVELVEDEILLGLPVAPRHEDCGLPGSDEAGERVSPFAALAGMKGKPN